jgi:hypothetical protein
MFAAILKTQWKWTRLAVLIAFVLAFAIPMLSLRVAGEEGPGVGAVNVIRAMQQFGVLYSILAGGLGLAVGMLAWTNDHRGRHVYALSLPVPRSRYVAMRFAAGTIFTAIPALGVLLGCMVGLATTVIPAGLQAYPVGLTLRFLLASFVSFAVFFAISSATTKAAGVILGGIAGIMGLLFVLRMLGVGDAIMQSVVVMLFADYGVLSVFTGRWMLIDV